MTFRQYLTLHLCPLLARLVLAATFIWFGFGKFKSMEFTGEDAGILISLGVGKIVDAELEPQDPELPPSTQRNLEQFSNRLAFTNAIFAAPLGYQEAVTEEEATPEEDAQTEPDNADNTVSPSDVAADSAGAVVPVIYATDKTVRAAGFHRITVKLQRAGHPSPVWMARLAVITEAIGGVLILLGLFTRIWGLGLAIAMGYAFYLTTWATLSGFADPESSGLGAVYQGLTSMGKLDFGKQISAFFQLGCFGLAMIVFLGGPGRFSLDQLIFRARSAPRPVLDEE